MAYNSFIVQLDDCTFLRGSHIIEPNFNFNTAGSLEAFDSNLKEDFRIDLISIKVQKNIGGKIYTFYSPPYGNSVDSLKIHIEFFNSVTIFYKEENPEEYHFIFKRNA